MAHEDLRIGVDLDAGRRVTVLVLAGEIDYATEPDLRTRLTEAMAAGRPLELDCAGVTFMSSVGLNVFAWVRKHHEPGVTVVDASPAVARLLEITGLDALMLPDPR